jgi:hypothetical protein
MDDYAQRITDHFLVRIGRSTTLSSMDQHYLQSLERAGAPLPAVCAGIDAAIAAKREPPHALSECKRWVTRALKDYAATGAIADLQGVASSGVASNTPADVPKNADMQPGALEQRLLQRLAQLQQKTSLSVQTRAAIVAFTDELRAIIDTERILDAATLLMLDDALLTQILLAHSADEQAALGVTATVDEHWQPKPAERERLFRSLGLSSLLDNHTLTTVHPGGASAR